MDSVLRYGAKLWTPSTDSMRKILAVEIDYLRRSTGYQERKVKQNSESRRNSAGTHRKKQLEMVWTRAVNE